MKPFHLDKSQLSLVVICILGLLASSWVSALEAERQTHPVGSTNFEVSEDFSRFGNEDIRKWLSGFRDGPHRRFFNEHLAWPDDAWVIEVPVPDEPDVYAGIAGLTIPVVLFLTYPTTADNDRPDYRFPFPDSENTLIQHMQRPGDAPIFADPDARYPLVVISHGRGAHGIWEIDHAQRLAGRGYMTLTLNFGDPRVYDDTTPLVETKFRPLAAYTALKAVLSSDHFGPHIDESRIATTGHSLGGYTSLAHTRPGSTHLRT